MDPLISSTCASAEASAVPETRKSRFWLSRRSVAKCDSIRPVRRRSLRSLMTFSLRSADQGCACECDRRSGRRCRAVRSLQMSPVHLLDPPPHPDGVAHRRDSGPSCPKLLAVALDLDLDPKWGRWGHWPEGPLETTFALLALSWDQVDLVSEVSAHELELSIEVLLSLAHRSRALGAIECCTDRLSGAVDIT